MTDIPHGEGISNLQKGDLVELYVGPAGGQRKTDPRLSACWRVGQVMNRFADKILQPVVSNNIHANANATSETSELLRYLKVSLL